MSSGNFLVISSTTAVVIGITWGGIQYPWSSARVLAPLVLGLVGLIGFFIYEAVSARYPIASFSSFHRLDCYSLWTRFRFPSSKTVQASAGKQRAILPV